MAYPAPFVSRPQRVEEQWIDYNGHFNMAYYLGADYVRERNCSFFTLECHNTYLHELHAGDVVRVESQFLDYDAKRVHYAQQMYHAGEGWLACVVEIMVMHIDLGLRKSSPFPADIIEKIAGMREAHRALPVPPQIGHRIGIPRKS
jgi:acyl-CoA thioester hydrolase